MSCPQCPHCQSGVEKGGQALISAVQSNGENNEERKETPKFPVRGKAREYSEAFELVWKAYVRREQKLEAFGVWLIRAKEVGGEAKLATLVLGSLRWQKPMWWRTWEREGKNVAPYLERYLKRRKWEDEPMPAPDAAMPRPVDDRAIRASDAYLARLRSVTPATPEQLAELKKATGRG